MKEYKYIYKLILNDEEPISLSLLQVAEIVSPKQSIEDTFCYQVSNEEHLDILLQKITSLYRVSYFHLNRIPLVVFLNKILLDKFQAHIKAFHLGEIECMLARKNKEHIIFEPNDTSDINSWLDETHEKEKYLISNSTEIFTQWKQNAASTQFSRIAAKYRLEIKLQKTIQELHALDRKLKLSEESLASVKIEFQKEIDWYKHEIEKVKTWHENEAQKSKEWYHDELNRIQEQIKKDHYQYQNIPKWYLKFGRIFKLLRSNE